MTIILTLDDKNGMMFNQRRLSSDRVIIERIRSLSADSRLWMNEYSAPLFAETDICIDADFISKAMLGDFCFVENVDPTPLCVRAEQIIVYRWNRHYPSDVKCNDLLTDWHLVKQTEFPGYSHTLITEEVYKR